MVQRELDDLVRIGQLRTERPAKSELEGLLRSGQFDLGYNAPHALALAALRLRGYRSESRYRVFQCLQHTIELPSTKGRWTSMNSSSRRCCA
jgi:hypothetical protein